MSEQPSPTGRASALSDIAIRRPVLTWMVMAALVVLGIFSFRRLPIDQFPKVDFPVVTVQTAYPGASAGTVERDVSRLLERAFQPIEGVRRVTSTSVDGVSQVVVEFELGRAIDVGAADVRTKLDGIRRELPRDIDPPLVQKLDPAAQPIVTLALTSRTLPTRTLTRLAEEDIRRALEGVSGVGEVRVVGGRPREVRVELHPWAMQALGVDVPTVMHALGNQNSDAPAGRLTRGVEESPVRVSGRVREPGDFASLVVATRGPSDRPVRLGDVAQVRDTTAEVRSLAFLDLGARSGPPAPAIAIEVLKVSGANTVAVSDAVQQAVERLGSTLPAEATLRLVRDNAVMIRQSVADVIDELLLGGVLTVLIVFLFLGDPKATAITAFTLPVSVISTFVLMGALGFTLNIMTLLALSICIGILIDDAIVVIENIVRYAQRGHGVLQAARDGTREIALAVLATTFTIVAVFVPVAFMRGLIGRFFFEFGVTVAWAVLVSLFVSFTLTPMLVVHWGIRTEHGGDRRGALGRLLRGVDVAVERLVARYRGVIGWSLRRRALTMGIALLSLVGALALAPLVGGGFAPDTDAGEVIVQFRTPEGSSLAFTAERAAALSAQITAMPEVAFAYVTVGSGAAASVRDGEAYVKLVPRHERVADQLEVSARLRTRLQPLFGLELSILQPGGPGGAAAPLSVQLRGPDAFALQRLADRFADRMRETPGVVDVRNSLGGLQPEIRVAPRRELASRNGLDAASLTATVRPLFSGTIATRWADPTGEERDVVVSLPGSGREQVRQILELPVPIRGGGEGGSRFVPLREVAEVVRDVAPSRIERFDLERAATLTASITSATTLSAATAALQAHADVLVLPPGYSISLGGDSEQLAETAGFLVEAIVLAVILIYLILASQFESLRQPFAIMLSLPLSLVGVMLALLLSGTTLNIMSMIGVIMLLGLVTKNAILLVDQTNTRRAQGANLTEAIIEAGAERLRPILMTTIAMIAGMLPIALALGEGGDFRAPMARAVIGGLITSTLLTLVVVPVGYSLLVGTRTAPLSERIGAPAEVPS